MNTKDFIRLGVPLGEATRRATDFISKFILGGGDKTRLEEEVKAIIANPSAFTEDSLRGEFAKALLNAPPPPRTEPIKYRQWGEGLEHEAVMQMEKACLLPVAVAGALMPDAHVGYGLPIGGVLATENAVIPYAVGVDIACRMKMTVLDIPARDLERHQDRLTRAIEAETRFGVGSTFKHRRQHEVLDADWSVSPVTKQNKDRAWSQLGTSGSGNHFVEFGLFTAHGNIHGLEPGTYVALLSHSGSRGTGAAVCDHYSKLAFSQFPDLPSELKRLAWLSLDSQDGCRLNFLTASSLASNIAAAPSLMPEELPAVTVPSFIKAGFNVASFSSDVCRGCSSVVTQLIRPLFVNSIAVISSSHLFADFAAKYFCCDANAKASCSLPEIFHCFATFSAVSPMEKG